jgi:lipoate-protein ligase A
VVRLVDTDLERPELTAAIDEALLESIKAGTCKDTLHLYRRRPSSVSIGYFQAADEVADVSACRADGVPVVRRISGGGAIFTDDRQLVYAVAFRPRRPLKAKEGFEMVCNAIVQALGRMGAEGARLSGINDVMVGGAKVSGTAQAIRHGAHLIHGTVLVDADLDAMFKYLRPLEPKLVREGLERPSQRVTTLAKVLDDPPSMAVVKATVVEELARTLDGDVEPGSMTPEEADMARELESLKYTQDSWNLRR